MESVFEVKESKMFTSRGHLSSWGRKHHNEASPWFQGHLYDKPEHELEDSSSGAESSAATSAPSPAPLCELVLLWSNNCVAELGCENLSTLGSNPIPIKHPLRPRGRSEVSHTIQSNPICVN